jgi:hypothetical protein
MTSVRMLPLLLISGMSMWASWPSVSSFFAIFTAHTV